MSDDGRSRTAEHWNTLIDWNADLRRRAEAVEAERDRLREALDEIANPDNEYFHDVSQDYLDGWDSGREWAGSIARAALDGEDDR